MAQPSAYEQYLLELVNRGRLDPAAEASRYGIGLNDGLAVGTISASAKQPLAWNLDLVDGARDHSYWMLENDSFSHSGSSGSSPGGRMQAAGYQFTGYWAWGENIAWAGTTGAPDIPSYVALEHEGLFLSEHHRVNTMEGDFQEIGLGVVQGQFTSNGVDFNTVMTTENFARSGSKQFLTGVAFSDRDADDFYTPGEGTEGFTFSVRASNGVTYTTASMEAGGYQQALPSGDFTVTISDGGLGASLQAGVSLGTENLKLDVVGEAALQCSGSLAMGANVRDLTLLGSADISGNGNDLANVIIGNSGANLLKGHGGADWMFGGTGNDRLYGGSGSDSLDGGQGYDLILGGDGEDRLIGGAGGDYLFGNAGDDVFVYQALSESCLAGGIDRIYDFVCGSDKVDVAAASIAAGLTQRSLTAADQYAEVYAGIGSVAANAMVAIDVASGSKAGSYLFINDGSSSLSSYGDALIQLTGITGSLSLSDFV